ncbi:hypothetical protein BJ912DRAFT_1050873 [Pholiota molesta]|nr:hypothetical protein BJ912DRAFT_1050873 [Pholiota molesta]
MAGSQHPPSRLVRERRDYTTVRHRLRLPPPRAPPLQRGMWAGFVTSRGHAYRRTDDRRAWRPVGAAASKRGGQRAGTAPARRCRVPLPSNEGCGPALARLPPPWPATTTTPEDETANNDDDQRGSWPVTTMASEDGAAVAIGTRRQHELGSSLDKEGAAWRGPQRGRPAETTWTGQVDVDRAGACERCRMHARGGWAEGRCRWVQARNGRLEAIGRWVQARGEGHPLSFACAHGRTTTLRTHARASERTSERRAGERANARTKDRSTKDGWLASRTAGWQAGRLTSEQDERQASMPAGWRAGRTASRTADQHDGWRTGQDGAGQGSRG